MYGTAPLLLFQLDLGNAKPALSHMFESAVAVTGGMHDFCQRKDRWPWHSAEPDGCIAFPEESPFLRDALPGVTARVLLGLPGSDTRVYVMFDDSAESASAFGLESAQEGWARFTLCLTTLEDAENPWIWSTFFDICSNGVAVGFSGQRTQLEVQLSSLVGVYPARTRDEWPEIHKLLHDVFVMEKVSTVLTGVPCIAMLPWGHEDMDGLFLVRDQCPRESVNRIQEAVVGQAAVSVFDDHDAYWTWAQEGKLPGVL